MRELYYNILSSFAPAFRYFYRKRLRVLAYHTIENPESFKKQIKFLKSKYSIISLLDLEEHLRGEKDLPLYPLLITFDDGDESVLKSGVPILKKNNCPAVLFVISGLINTNCDFWWNTVAKNERQYGKNDNEIQEQLSYLKQISNKEREIELEKYKSTGKTQLTASQLKYLNKNHVAIANHSHTHPMFNQCSTEEIELEISRSKKMFMEWEIGEFDVFAYPNGNYDEKVEKILLDKGIRLAFLFDHRINSEEINPLRISRIRVSAETRLAEFDAKVSAIHPFIYSIFK